MNNPSEAFKREGCVSVGLALRVFYVMFTFCSILGGIVLFKEFHEHGRCVVRAVGQLLMRPEQCRRHVRHLAYDTT